MRLTFKYLGERGYHLRLVFFPMRPWKKRIPTDDNLHKIKMNIVFRCYCCDVYQQKTMQHLFLTSSITQKLWEHFVKCGGFTMTWVHLQQIVTQRWQVKGPNKIRNIYWIILTMVLWELWKRRNARRDDKDARLRNLIKSYGNTINQFIKIFHHWVQCPTLGGGCFLFSTV